ncbi:MAG TPA: hypothetical protein VLA33_10000 [Gemmatimonadota bacterium]|nr:hypothetical protein [Gemmatimonadota bacterium]
MSNSLKQVRRIMFVTFAATTGVVACDSVTAPEQSVAAELKAVDRQVNEAELMQDIERFRSRGSGSKTEAVAE